MDHPGRRPLPHQLAPRHRLAPRHLLARPLALASAPVLLPQAWWVRRTTPRLPEAAGLRSGVADGAEVAGVADGVRAGLSLVVLGESTAVGVGAPTQQEALAAILARRLAERGGPVAWSAVGRSGHRIARTLTDAVPRLAGGYDLVVVASGVNDVMAMTSVRRWRTGVNALLEALGPHLQESGRIVLSGLPPMRQFPALPQPARELAGRHAEALDAVLRLVAAEHASAGVLHVPLTHLVGADHLAPDGFHPSAAGYRAWAGAILAAMGD